MRQYTAPDPKSLTSNSHLLTLLPSEPANPDLAIGTTSALPPTPDSLAENPKFLSLLQETVKAHAHNDPDVQAQAQVYASNAGASLGSGGAFFGQPPASRRRRSGPSGGGGGTGGDGGGGASAQGGAGSGARGGWIHVSDSRSPPDFGRIAWYVKNFIIGVYVQRALPVLAAAGNLKCGDFAAAALSLPSGPSGRIYAVVQGFDLQGEARLTNPHVFSPVNLR